MLYCWSSELKEMCLKPKLALWLASSAQRHLPPIKLSNYRKQLFSCFLGSEEIHPVKD